MNRVCYPLVPQRVAQNAILLFLPVKFNLCRKNSATKFLCVKTSSSIVVSTSFLYLLVHRWIAGDVHIYLKFALKVTHPFRKRRGDCGLHIASPSLRMTNCPWKGRGHCHVTSYVVCALSNGHVAYDLGWPLSALTTSISTFCTANAFS